MFKKNPARPPITISLRRTSQGYRITPNEALQLFTTKKIIRSIYRPDLMQMSNQHIEGVGNNNSMTSGTMIQPPAHVTIPALANWFNEEQIHQLQKKAFPEFFKQQLQNDDKFSFAIKNANLYLYYRNSMIQMWRQNAKKYFSLSLCRKNLLGDVSSIMRIHAFLQNWGLINFPSKQHNKGVALAKSEIMQCYICEENCSKYYYATQLQDIIFQICSTCYNEELYPQSIQKQEFKKVLLQNYINQQTQARQLDKSQTIKLLEVLNSLASGSRDKDRDVWSILQKQFPELPKEQLLKIFLKIPINYEMNSNFFQNNEDYISFENLQQKKQIDELKNPSIFENFENPILGSIAMNYYSWISTKQVLKTCEISQLNEHDQKKYELLDKIFVSCQSHAKYLAADQQNKISQLTKMLIQVVLSKLQLKTLFINQYEKLLQSSETVVQNLFQNNLAESLKLNWRITSEDSEAMKLQQNPKKNLNGWQGEENHQQEDFKFEDILQEKE